MRTVLVLEDEEQVRVLAEAILKDSGFATLSASDVEEAQHPRDGTADRRVVYRPEPQIKDAGWIGRRQDGPGQEPELRVVF